MQGIPLQRRVSSIMKGGTVEDDDGATAPLSSTDDFEESAAAATEQLLREANGNSSSTPTSHGKGLEPLEIETEGLSGSHGGASGHLSSVGRTFVNTLIAFVGAGILGIPKAFMEGGLVLSGVVLAIVGVVSLGCMWMLIQCKYMIMKSQGEEVAGDEEGDPRQQHQHQQHRSLTYSRICQVALGRTGFLAVEGALVVTQSGFSSAYLIFIARNLNDLFGLPKVPVILGCLPFITALCLLKHLKYLAPFSLLAEVVNLTGLAVIYGKDVEYYQLDHPEIDSWKIGALPFVFGVAVYCFEGMGMVLPLEASMREKKRFFPILSLVMFLYTSLCISSGALGYMAFGSATEDIILSNLPGSAYATTVKLSFCVGLFFTFPIMMIPVWEVLELKWLDASSSSYERSRNLLRAGLVMGTGFTAASVPNFGLFISLIGSSCCSLLAFILPPLCYRSLRRQSGRLPALHSGGLVAIAVAGLFAAVVGTVHSLQQLAAGQR